jgi:hypothetical protein
LHHIQCIAILQYRLGAVTLTRAEPGQAVA